MGLLLVLSIVFILQFGQISRFLGAVQAGNPYWIGLAFVIQAGWQAIQVSEFRATHKIAGSSQPWPAIAPAVLANNFIVVATPTGSLSTFALFLADARRRQLRPTPVALGVILFAVAEYLALSLLILFVLLFTADRRLYGLIAIPGLIIFAAAGLFSAAVGLGLYSPPHLACWLNRIAKPLNKLTLRFGRPEIIPEQTIANITNALTEEGLALRQATLWKWLAPLGYGLCARIVLTLLLGALCLAFDQALPWQSLVTGVVVASIYTIVSPTPQGIGVAEGALAYTLATWGVPNEQAILISLTYRGFSLGLPMIYGFAALQWAGLQTVIHHQPS